MCCQLRVWHSSARPGVAGGEKHIPGCDFQISSPAAPGCDANTPLAVLTSAVQGSHVRAVAMIPPVLTNGIRKAVPGPSSSEPDSPALFGGSLARSEVRLYESYLFILGQCLGGLALGQEPAVLVRCCTASRPRAWLLPRRGKRRAGKGRSHPQTLGIPFVFLPNLPRRCWEGEKAFALLEREGVLQRKYSFSILLLKPVTGVRWIQRFRFYWPTMTHSWQNLFLRKR